MADGRVVIDTKLDTSGIEIGIKKINTILKGGIAIASLASIKQVVADISAETEKLGDSLRKASTLFGDTAVNSSLLTARMTELSSATGFAAEELGNALYDALSAGIPVTEDMAEATTFLESSAKTAKGGFADLSQTVTATASVLNAYGLSVSETERIQGILIQTQNKGITTVGQLASSLAQVVPTAAAFGVSFEQVGAAIATITAQGTQTAQATTSLNNLFSELGKQSQQAAKNLALAAESAGLSERTFQDFIDEGYTITDILLIMQEYAKGTGLSLVDMFGSVEAGRAALQLVTGEGSKFTSSLEAMSDTSRLVEDAFNKVYSSADKLRAALANAKKTIGAEFAPVASTIAEKLADMVNALTGNRDTAGELETALTNLKTATDAYKSAQEQAKDSTDDLTESMIRQAGEAQRQTILDFASAYNAAMKSISKNQKEIDKGKNVISEMEKRLDDLALTAGYTRDEMSALYAANRLPEGLVSDYELFTGEIDRQTEKISTLSGGLDKLNESYEETLLSAARMVSSGSISIDAIAASSTDLEKDVRRLAGAYNEGAVKAASFLDATSNTTVIKAVRDRLEKQRSTLSKTSGEYFILTGQVEALNSALQALQDTQAGKESTSTATSSSTSTTSTSSSSSASSRKSPADIYEEANKALRDTETLSRILGDSFDKTGEKTNILEAAIRSLVESGLDEGDMRIRIFSERLRALQYEMEDTGKSIDDVKDIFIDFFSEESLTNTFTSSLTSGMSAFINTIATAGSKIEELKEEILDTQAKLNDAEQDRAEIVEELNDARARGDEEDIERAEERLASLDEMVDGYKELIKSNEKEQKALQSGEEAWKAFGRSALEALASVLEGLGARLAAEAVAQAISFNWAGAAIATAGSVAAYVAAAGLKTAANSFADGGIVQQKSGISSTGDNHIAFVNPGELILTRAQQANLADQIRAASERNGMSSGSAIIVNLSGAYIYGLDEPAVGKAIYQNIRNLQAEGVL